MTSGESIDETRSALPAAIVRTLSINPEVPMRMREILAALQLDGWPELDMGALSAEMCRMRSDSLIKGIKGGGPKRNIRYVLASSDGSIEAVPAAKMDQPESPEAQAIRARIREYFERTPAAKAPGVKRYLESHSIDASYKEIKAHLEYLRLSGQLRRSKQGFYSLPENEALAQKAEVNALWKRKPSPASKSSEYNANKGTKRVRGGKCDRCGKKVSRLTCVMREWSARYVCSPCAERLCAQNARSKARPWIRIIPTGMGTKK